MTPHSHEYYLHVFNFHLMHVRNVTLAQLSHVYIARFAQCIIQFYLFISTVEQISTLPLQSKSQTDSIMDSLTIDQVDAKFQKACSILRKLNDQMDQLETRHARAGARGQKSFTYNQRIRLCVLEGVKDVCYQYAHRLAVTLDDMRREAGYIVIGSDEEEWSDTDSVN